jgi:matrixin
VPVPALLATVALALLAAAPAARADDAAFAPGTANEARARDVARAAWGAEPCDGQATIAWLDQDPQLNATAIWDNPIGDYADALLNQDCQIRFNPGVAFDWPRYCSVMVHEYGHLLGHPHSPDPADVMYRLYLRPIAACANPVAAARPRTPATVHARPRVR